MSRKVRLYTLVLLIALPMMAAWSANPWWNTNWHYRVAVSVNGGGYERTNKPVEMNVNFTSVLTSLGRVGAFDYSSLHLIEVDGVGAVLDSAVAFQFDRANGYNATSNASGTLIILLKGTTASGATRSFDVYFDLAGGSFVPEGVGTQVSYQDNVQYAGQASYQISTPSGTYYYHKTSGGFAGWKDKDGLEWLGFDPTPGSGASGEYRGLPNAVYNPPNPGFFHPGFSNSTSSVQWSGPLKMTIDSKSTDSGNPWECTWEIFPTYARMTMIVLGNSNYWFLYEGTPGGNYDPNTDFVVRSNGQRNLVSDSWEGPIPSPEFVYFGDANLNRVFYAVHHEADNRIDSYRPLADANSGIDAMTVFGFGRDIVVTSFFDVVPQHFTIGFSEDSGFTPTSKTIASAFRPISGVVGQAEELTLSAPLLASPVDNSGNLPTTVTCVWHPVSGATSYWLQVSTTSNFSGGMVFSDSAIVDTTRQVNGLTLNTTYYWRVRGGKQGAFGPASSVWHFATGLSSPTPLSPPSGATGQSSVLSLMWSSVPTALSYRVQVATNGSFLSGIVVDDSSMVDTTRSVGPLAGGTQFFWRVFARGGSGSSLPSAAFNFITALQTPQLLEPADNGTTPGSTGTLRWARVSGATWYHLQVATDAGFSTGILINDSTMTDSLRSLSGLTTGIRYYWRVRARTTVASGAFAGRSFVAALVSPTLVRPLDGATAQLQTIVLVWRKVAGATNYHLQLGTDSTFTSGLVKNDSTLVDSTRTVAGLLSFTRYFWRVSALAGGTGGVFSATWRFRTEAPLPGQVQLVSPAQTASVGLPFVLRWNKTQPAASRYWFELGVDSLFNIRSIDSTLTDTSKTETSLPFGRYWWRVKGGNIEAWGQLSETRLFTVIDLSVTGRGDVVPQSYVLTQNYPNPFNPTTNIEFGLPRTGHVVLEVFNILGGRVAILANETLQPGMYQVQFDARGLTSGIYFYRLITPEGSLLRKMLVVK